jgi:hypothetical protein
MNVKKTLIFCLISIFLVSGVFGKENISQNTTWSSRPSVAVNKDGVVLAVWIENAREYESGPIYYRVKEDGNWGPVRKVGIVERTGWTPLLDVDENGIFHMTYSDGFSVYDREVYYCYYDPDSGWGRSEMIHQSPHNSAWPKINIIGDWIHIGWTHRNTDPYTGADIVMISKKMEDTTWPAVYERITWSAYDISGHVAFKMRGDKVFAAYMEGFVDHGPWRLFYKENMRGTSWRDIPVEGPLYGNAYYPELELDDDDNVHVIWGNREGIMPYAQKINGVWKPNQVISNMHTARQMPDLRYKNSILVAAFTQGSDPEDLYYATKVIGGPWEKPVLVAEGHKAAHPRVWIDDDANAHFVWEEEGGLGGARDISYQKIAVAPTAPFIKLEPQSMHFTVEGFNPDPATLTVKNIGKKNLNYTVSVDQPWLTVTPISGNLGQDEEHELLCNIDAIGLEETTHTATVEITSNEAINSPRKLTVTVEVLAPPIYPPVNFTGEVMENKSMFYREYMQKLTWEANPINRNIEKYRLYEIDGLDTYFVAEFPASTFEYTRRHTLKGKSYSYELWAVDNLGRTGSDPAVLTLGTSSLFDKEEKEANTTAIKSYIVK